MDVGFSVPYAPGGIGEAGVFVFCGLCPSCGEVACHVAHGAAGYGLFAEHCDSGFAQGVYEGTSHAVGEDGCKVFALRRGCQFADCFCAGWGILDFKPGHGGGSSAYDIRIETEPHLPDCALRNGIQILPLNSMCKFGVDFLAVLQIDNPSLQYKCKVYYKDSVGKQYEEHTFIDFAILRDGDTAVQD